MQTDFSSYVEEKSCTISIKSLDVLHHDWVNGEDLVSSRSLMSHGSRDNNFEYSWSRLISWSTDNTEDVFPWKLANPLEKIGYVDKFGECWSHGYLKGLTLLMIVTVLGLSRNLCFKLRWLSSVNVLSSKVEDSTNKEPRLLAAKHYKALMEP